MQQFGQKIQTVTVRVKACPTCNAQFESETRLCPHDESLLYPVANDQFTQLRIGDFTIVRQLGEGSAGKVYLCHNQVGAFDAAIKILRCELASDVSNVKRFQEEARILRSLHHANIAQLYDFGVMDDGLPYLVMEYLPGLTLAEKLERSGPLPCAKARALFYQMADALEAAHSRGILHRDIKPSNLIITDDGAVKIVDFGIAKTGDGDGNATVTKTGITLGTPAYMSPEQCMGKDLDIRSDIYAFGCVMFECLTGKKVFANDNAFGCMWKHTVEAAPSISKLRIDLPEDLANAVMVCLNKNPDDRFQSMAELTAVLEGVPTKRRYQPPKTKKTTKRILGLRTIAMICCALPLIAFFVHSIISSPKSTPEDYVDPIPQGVSFGDNPETTKETPASITLLKKEFSDIESAITALKKQGKTGEANAMRDELESFKRLYTTSTYPAPAKPLGDIQEVAIGKIDPEHPDRALTQAPIDARILVSYTGEPVTLIVDAVQNANIRLDAAKGARIDKAYLVGKGSKMNLHMGANCSGVPVVKLIEAPTVDNAFATAAYYGEKANLETFFNKPLSVAVYEPGNQTLIAGPENKDWRAQHVLHQMKDFYSRSMAGSHAQLLERMNKLTFQGMEVVNLPLMNVDANGESWTEPQPAKVLFGKIGFGYVKGIIDAFPFRPRHATKAGNTWYIADWASVHSIDQSGNRTEQIELLSHQDVRGLTFDSKRNRLLALSADSFNQYARLRSYDLSKKQWSLVTIFEGSQYHGLAYSQDDDALYLLRIPIREKEARPATLLKFSADGSLISTTEIPQLLNDWQTVDVQLNAVGPFLSARISAALYDTKLGMTKGTLLFNRDNNKLVVSKFSFTKR